MKLFRFIIAVPLGCIVLLLLTFPVIDGLGLWLFPLPTHMRIGETAMDEIIASRPAAAVLLNFVLRVPAVFLGTWLAARVAPSYGTWHGIVVMLMFLTLIVIGALFAPFPLWATLLGAVCFPISGYLGARHGAQTPAKRADTIEHRQAESVR